MDKQDRAAMMLAALMALGLLYGIVSQWPPRLPKEIIVYKVSDEERAAANELVMWLRGGHLVCSNGPLVIPQYSCMENLHVVVIPHVPLQSIIEMHDHSVLSRTYVYGIGGANPYLWMPAVALARNYVEPTPPGWEEVFSLVSAKGEENTIDTFQWDATAPPPGKSSATLVRGE